MPTSVTSAPTGTMNRFQGPIPLHLNPQYSRQPVSRASLLFPPDMDYDGRKLRRTAMRKTVDYNAAIVKVLENRIWQRDYRDGEIMQPDVLYTPYMMPPIGYENNYTNAVTTRFVKAASNKVRCPIFCVAWTPEGRRLITGTSSGEFTLWNGLTFNFETILQAHDSPVRTMVWSHNDCWMVTGDHMGFVKYWQSNMNNVKMFQAHREPVRGVSFSPSDNKFATCSDDGTVRIWDFIKCEEERVLRGHGADVKCVDWHPYKSLIASGSKDSQQPVKLWDPRSGKSFGTLHAHKSTVMDIKWNRNGNWLMTASRDHMLKLFDVRNFATELQVFRGHKKEASVLAWHPQHEGLICSGGTDGSILFWHVGTDREVAAIEQAHDSIVWALAWHPVGHILCSGSNDHSSKYWSRNLPGDTMRDKYNLNTNPYGGLMSFEERNPDGYIPGMGPEDKVDPDKLMQKSIPGLDNLISDDKVKVTRKIPYAKPIPKEFQAAWNDKRQDGVPGTTPLPLHKEFLQKLLLYAPGVKYVHEIKPDALFMYNRMIPILPNSDLEKAAKGGEDNLIYFIKSGRVPELNSVMPYDELWPNFDDQLMAVDEAFSCDNDFDMRSYSSSSPSLVTASTTATQSKDFRANFTSGAPSKSAANRNQQQNYYHHHHHHNSNRHQQSVTDDDRSRSPDAASRQALLQPPPPLPSLPSELLDDAEASMDAASGSPPLPRKGPSSFHNNNNSNNNNGRFSSNTDHRNNNNNNSSSHRGARGNNEIMDTNNRRKFNHQFNGTFKQQQPYRGGSGSSGSNFEQHRDEISSGYYDDDDDNDQTKDDNEYYDDNGYEDDWKNGNDYDEDRYDYGGDHHSSYDDGDKYGRSRGGRGGGGGNDNRFPSWRNDRGSRAQPRGVFGGNRNVRGVGGGRRDDHHIGGRGRGDNYMGPAANSSRGRGDNYMGPAANSSRGRGDNYMGPAANSSRGRGDNYNMGGGRNIRGGMMRGNGGDMRRPAPSSERDFYQQRRDNKRSRPNFRGGGNNNR